MLVIELQSETCSGLLVKKTSKGKGVEKGLKENMAE
jgi:hypothetical protein